MEIVVNGLSKQFGTAGGRGLALDRVSFRLQRGEMVALLGASGSGKSTLMRHLGGLVAGTAGEVWVDGRVVQRAGKVSPRIRDLRAEMGVIFQQFNLVGRLTVLTNVLAGLIHRRPLWRTCLLQFSRADKRAALEALSRVGMADYAHQRASTLSGGQQQRVAIARTLLQRARVVLGDEPIASLDPQSARSVMDSLRRINREDGVSCLVSLHQVDYALEYCPRTIALAGGRVVFDGPSTELTAARLGQIYGDGSGRPELRRSPEVELPAVAEPAVA